VGPTSDHGVDARDLLVGLDTRGGREPANRDDGPVVVLRGDLLVTLEGLSWSLERPTSYHLLQKLRQKHQTKRFRPVKTPVRVHTPTDCITLVLNSSRILISGSVLPFLGSTYSASGG